MWVKIIDADGRVQDRVPLVTPSQTYECKRAFQLLETVVITDDEELLFSFKWIHYGAKGVAVCAGDSIHMEWPKGLTEVVGLLKATP